MVVHRVSCNANYQVTTGAHFFSCKLYSTFRRHIRVENTHLCSAGQIQKNLAEIIEKLGSIAGLTLYTALMIKFIILLGPIEITRYT